jgi:hypothetical protein
MKILTTLTAVAALVAGISIAAAQAPTMDRSQTSDKASGTQLDMNSAGTKPGKSQVTGNAAFCINTSASGALNCKYASMAACEKDAKSQNLNCSPNPKKSTTGTNPNSK